VDSRSGPRDLKGCTLNNMHRIVPFVYIEPAVGCKLNHIFFLDLKAMHATGNEFQQLVELAPEWQSTVHKVMQQGTISSVVAGELGRSTACAYAVLEQIGAQSIFIKLSNSSQNHAQFLKLVRDNYLLVLATKMFKSNSALRHFFGERRLNLEDQKGQAMSMAVEMAMKLEHLLLRSLKEADSSGFKSLLPAYIQRSVNNAVLDYIKSESQWERQSVAESTEEGEDDAITRTADDLEQIPESVALSGEKVHYLNELRHKLQSWYKTADANDLAFAVIDCMFGLGLTAHSTPGKELTMRECCDVLKLEGETQARKIARCQVLLDRGMDKIRHLLRDELPGVVDCWQKEINVNVASRRDLNHQLDFTEGEVERLVVNRQYVVLEQLVERAIVKAEKIAVLRKKGAVAAFVPVDLNAATARELTDIIGVPKDVAQKIVAARPLNGFQDLVKRKLLPASALDSLKERGAVLKSIDVLEQKGNPDLNKVDEAQLLKNGVARERAALIVRARPFASWAELDQFLACDEVSWLHIRSNFSLGQKPA
jgi:DNA uptake protein ComE-like DNA-binding protein